MGSTMSKISRAAGRFVDRVDRWFTRLGRWLVRDDGLNALKEREERWPQEPSAFGNVGAMDGRIRRPQAKHGRLESIRWAGQGECSYCCDGL